jgi:hypothetical protein
VLAARAALNKHPCSRIEVLPEFLGRAGLFLFEDPVEVGDIIEAAVVGYLSNGMRRVDEHSGSMSQSYLIQAVDKSIARPLFDEPAKGDLRHIYHPCDFTQGYGFVIIIIHVFECLLDATAIVGEMLVGKRGIRQSAHIA